MAGKPNLTVVPDGAHAPKPQTVVEAAEHGSRLDLLIATRDRIARAVDSPDCPPRDLAALTRRLVDTAKEIEAIELAEKAEAERGGQVADQAFDASAL